MLLIERGQEVGGGDTAQWWALWLTSSIISDLPTAAGHCTCSAETKIEITEWLDDAPYPRALVAERPEAGNATIQRAQGILKQMAEFTQQAHEMGYRINPLDSEAVAAASIWRS